MIFKFEEFFVIEYNEYSEYNEFVALLLQYCVHKSLKMWREGTYKESVRFMCFIC